MGQGSRPYKASRASKDEMSHEVVDGEMRRSAIFFTYLSGLSGSQIFLADLLVVVREGLDSRYLNSG